MERKKGISVIFTAMFSALICVGCFIHIPLAGGVPIVIQDMLAILSGLVLGPVLGGAAVIVFFLLGCIGLPVFSGKAGIHVLFGGPTCGFLWGYLVAAVVSGLILKIVLNPEKNHSKAKMWILIIATILISRVILFAFGMTGFHLITGKDWSTTAKATLWPFMPGNIIKMAVSVPLTKYLRELTAKYMWNDVEDSEEKSGE